MRLDRRGEFRECTYDPSDKWRGTNARVMLVEMDATRRFRSLSKHDTGIAGGKGASLGEMARAGFPVPSGFVILSSAFDQLLDDANLNRKIDVTLHSVNHEDVHTAELA